MPESEARSVSACAPHCDWFAGKLWTAPELLRMQCRPPEGTAKGDVFSFAIICQEIVYRNGVFFLTNLDLTPQGTS